MTNSVAPKPGSPASRKKEAVRIAEAMGVLPIEVMLEAMNYHVSRARRELKKAEEIDELTMQPYGEAGVNHNLVSLCYGNAVNCARDAAPYVHPKLVPRMNDVEDPNTKAQQILAAIQEIEEASGVLPDDRAAYRGPNLDSDLGNDTMN
jgi:hypothetical protein